MTIKQMIIFKADIALNNAINFTAQNGLYYIFLDEFSKWREI